MKITDTAENVCVCDCGSTGGCSQFQVDYHPWLFEQVRCPSCGKILEPHYCIVWPEFRYCDVWTRDLAQSRTDTTFGNE